MKAWAREPNCPAGFPTAPKNISIPGCAVPAVSTGCGAGVAVVSVPWGKPPQVEIHTVASGGGGSGITHAVPPFPEDASFEIASITKVFTAILLQLLVDHGELTMDTTVGHFLDGRCGARGDLLNSDVSTITLLELATHTSGLPGVPDNRHMSGDNPYALYTEKDLCECLARLKELPSRGSFMYSDLAFGLLGYLLELHQGQSFEELLKKHILKPLNMDNTKISLDCEDWSHVVPGNDRASGTGPVWRHDKYGILQGNGALHSTLGDMAKFLAAAVRAERGEDGPLVGPIRRTMHDVQWDCPCYTDACEHLKWWCSGDQQNTWRGTVGLGWQSFSHGLRHGWLKSGDTEGYSSFMALISEAGRAVIGFDTCAGCGPEGGQGSALQRAVKILVGGPPAPRQPAPRVLCSELESISGVYESSHNRTLLKVSVSRCEKGGEDMTITVKTWTGLFPTSKSAESEATPFALAGRRTDGMPIGLELKSPIGSDGIGATDVRPLTVVSQNREIVFLSPRPGSVADAVLSDGGLDTFFDKKGKVEEF